MSSRLVVADDDADLRALVEAVLTTAGYSVVAVHDGPAALHAIRTLAPVAAVLDVSMPGLTGREVCQLLKGDPRTDRCGVLLVSADATPADVAAAHGSGADDFLAKPFRPRELLDRVESLLAGLDPISREDPSR